MKAHTIPYEQTGFFSTLILDYLKQEKTLNAFYEAFPSIDNFKKQTELKAPTYSRSQRQLLVRTLEAQYVNTSLSDATAANIKRLEKASTFTITTGHQLSLLTGPLYFIFKIVSTIKLCQQLKKAMPSKDFVPVYWMASEDHDFEEISHFSFKGKKFQWEHPNSGGKVGDLSLDSLQSILDLLTKELPESESGNQLKEWINRSYRSSQTLGEATRSLVNALFAETGLIILDGDDPDLKKSFIPYFQKELEKQDCFKETQNQIEQLQQNYHPSYKPQVTPREINLFYLTPQKRQRIITHEAGYRWDGDPRVRSKETMLSLLNDHPENFSPNVIMRPLYQEVLLPNLGYIGGGGELAYWFQLKSFFESQKVPFPLLILRNSAVLVNGKTVGKMNKLDLRPEDLFLKRPDLVNKKVQQLSAIDLDLQFLKKELEKNFRHLKGLVKQTDASYEGAVAAQQQKQFKGIDHLEKRLLRAQKRKLKDQVERLEKLHESLFPNSGLQERKVNFSTFYLEKGPSLIPQLLESFDPLKFQFTWIEL